MGVFRFWSWSKTGLKLANVPMASSLQEWLLQLPGVSQSPHRFGGTEYRVNGLEFMHSHSPTYLDIRLSLEDQKQVLETERAAPHRFAPLGGMGHIPSQVGEGPGNGERSDHVGLYKC